MKYFIFLSVDAGVNQTSSNVAYIMHVAYLTFNLLTLSELFTQSDTAMAHCHGSIHY